MEKEAKYSLKRRSEGSYYVRRLHRSYSELNALKAEMRSLKHELEEKNKLFISLDGETEVLKAQLERQLESNSKLKRLMRVQRLENVSLKEKISNFHCILSQ